MAKSRNILRIVICLLLMHGYVDSSVLIADFAMSRMIELFSKRPYCKLHSDRGVIQKMFIKTDPRKVRQVAPENLIALEEVCMEAGGLSGELQGGLGFIYPGTKWCGPGNIASEYSELGRYADEDRCCREHDLCPNTLSPGECQRGLCNSQQFTRSHCDCDTKFRKCLQGLNTEIANTLGAVFFNVVQVTCFKERRPCSIHQSENCTNKFYLSGLYLSPPAITMHHNHINNNVIEHSSHSQTNTIQDNDNKNDKKSLDESLPRSQKADRIREIKLTSIALFAKNLFKDIVVRQISGIYQLFKTARDIFYDA